MTSGSSYPGIANIEDMLFYAEGKSVSDVVDIALGNIDNDYFETLGLKLIAGRGFSREFTVDSSSIILNEVAIKALGYNIHTAVGKNVHFDFQGTHNTMRIVGIVRNFNFEGLYNAIKPFAYNKVLGNRYSYLIATLKTNDYKTILKETEQSWSQINPGIPLFIHLWTRISRRIMKRSAHFRNGGLLCYSGHRNFLFGIVRTIGFRCRATDKRNRHPKSSWRLSG